MPHKALHAQIKKIADLKKQGDLAGAEREYEQIEPMSVNIVKLMGKIKEQL